MKVRDTLSIDKIWCTLPDKMENFTSLAGPRYYGLAPNEETITLVKGDPVIYTDHIDTRDGPVTVFNPGFPLHWRVEQSSLERD